MERNRAIFLLVKLLYKLLFKSSFALVCHIFISNTWGYIRVGTLYAAILRYFLFWISWIALSIFAASDSRIRRLFCIWWNSPRVSDSYYSWYAVLYAKCLYPPPWYSPFFSRLSYGKVFHVTISFWNKSYVVGGFGYITLFNSIIPNANKVNLKHKLASSVYGSP